MKFAFFWAKIFKKLHGTAIKNCVIDNTSKIEAGSHVVNSIMKRHSFCGYNCEIINCDIGAFCSIANNVIIGGGMHPMGWVSMSPVFYEGRDSVKAKFSSFKRELPKRTIIGNDVWIGQNVLIKQGVNIGTGAVVGMGSVVTKDIEPYAIVAGTPARIIRYRFSEEIIEKLFLSKWWDLPNEALQNHAKYITDPEKFLQSLSL